MKQNALMGAAIAGLMAATALSAVTATAADTKSEKGHCVGANSCKGKAGCKQVGQNDCKGQNGCKGKGYVEMTKDKCDKLAKKDSNIHFEQPSM